jgi:hypothetical protein
MNITTINSNDKCRLCNSETNYQFKKIILNKYEVKYFKCTYCKSLQTENPYWLNEAYIVNLSKFDTGAAQRVLNNFTKTFIISRILKIKNILDLGGGDGLFCRLLRDHSINCFSRDKYAKPTYAQEFQIPTFEKPDLVTAFEVVEHFSRPHSDFNELFELEPSLLLLSTGIYNSQDEDWWYLNPESGQHIFMYGKEAFGLIGERYGYTPHFLGELILFTKRNYGISLQIMALKVMFKRPFYDLLKGLIFMLATNGSWQDHLKMRNPKL